MTLPLAVASGAERVAAMIANNPATRQTSVTTQVIEPVPGGVFRP